MPHGPDAAAPTTRTNQTINQGAATMARYTTMRTTLNDTVRRMIENSISPATEPMTHSAPSPAAEKAPVTKGFPGTKNSRRDRRVGAVTHGQGYHVQPRRPLRIPGR